MDQQMPPMPQSGLEQSSISLSAQAELELELSLRGSLLVQQQRRIVQLEDELQRAWSEIERLRTKLGALERERTPNDEDGSRQPRYWTPEEHTLFVEAVQRYGWKDVKAISQHVGTRNPTQVCHAPTPLLDNIASLCWASSRPMRPSDVFLRSHAPCRSGPHACAKASFASAKGASRCHAGFEQWSRAPPSPPWSRRTSERA